MRTRLVLAVLLVAAAGWLLLDAQGRWSGAPDRAAASVQYCGFLNPDPAPGCVRDATEAQPIIDAAVASDRSTAKGEIAGGLALLAAAALAGYPAARRSLSSRRPSARPSS